MQRPRHRRVRRDWVAKPGQVKGAGPHSMIWGLEFAHMGHTGAGPREAAVLLTTVC